MGSAIKVTAGTTRTQAGAVPITESTTHVIGSTAPAAGSNLGDGLVLPQLGGGHVECRVSNTTANPVQVYGNASDTLNGIAASQGVMVPPGSVAHFNSEMAGEWIAQCVSQQNATYGANAATAGTTLHVSDVAGGGSTVDLALTGTLAAAANAQLPTVAALVAAMPVPAIGNSYILRVTNRSGGAFSWTVTTNTGWTLTGTMSIAQNTWREFVVTLTSLTTATLQSVATGTYS